MHVHLCVDKCVWVQMSAEPRRGFGFSGIGVAWGWKAAQITLGMSVRAASAHNHRATSPTPKQLLFIKISKDQCWCCKPVMQLVFNNFYISQGFCNSARDSFSHSDFHTSCVFLNNKISFTDFLKVSYKVYPHHIQPPFLPKLLPDSLPPLHVFSILQPISWSSGS